MKGSNPVTLAGRKDPKSVVVHADRPTASREKSRMRSHTTATASATCCGVGASGIASKVPSYVLYVLVSSSYPTRMNIEPSACTTGRLTILVSSGIPGGMATSCFTGLRRFVESMGGGSW
jgi:hypothetical protein